MFSCEFFEISKNTFSYRTALVAASEKKKAKLKLRFLKNHRKGDQGFLAKMGVSHTMFFFFNKNQ